MDIRTATELCMLDLAPLIEAGDFRKLGEAERIITALAGSAVADRDRGALLYALADRLNAVDAPTRPENDAYLRAVKATIRQKLQRCFERRRLTTSAPFGSITYAP